MSKMTDAPENRLRRLTTTAIAVEHADGVPATANAAPPFRNDPCAAASVCVPSGQTVAFQPCLLVYGHIHLSVDCGEVASTRVLCNPHCCRDKNPDLNAPWS